MSTQLRARALAGLATLLALALCSGLAPSAPMTAAPEAGATPKHGSVTLELGYYPPSDPESSSVRIGRRLGAPLVSKHFTGGARSLDDLGRRVLHALEYQRSDSIMALCVRADEFRDILWQEFPQSRPATGATWQDAWIFLFGRLHGGSVATARDYGGHRYQFERFERYDSTQVYKNFKLHKGLILYARDEDGQEQRFTWLRAAVERKGRFKIYSMHD